MKIRKISKTIIIFITAMILVCVLLSLLLSISTGNFEELLNRTLNYLLYIIGYGSLMHDSLLLQDIFGILGIVTVSILSAYITVNLFWRVDDVFISKNISIWNSTSNKYFASVLIGNKGKNICKLELSFVAYDENKNPLGEISNNFTYPLLIKSGTWQIDMPIENGFLFRLLRYIRKEKKDCKIYATFEYVDSGTGQSSIMVQEYNSEHIFVSTIEGGFYNSSNCDKKSKWGQFKNIDKDLQKDLIFDNWICRDTIVFDLKKTIPINGNQIKLNTDNNIDENSILHAEIDFNTTENPPDFVIALLAFNNPYQNWTSYYSMGSSFQFEISGDEGIGEIQLEIKDKWGAKLIDEKIIVTKDVTKHPFKLDKNKELSSESFSEVKEICFTVFRKCDGLNKGSITIHSCEILVENLLTSSVSTN